MIGNGETLHFHRTDGDGEWLVRLTPDGPEVERAHAKGDVAVRGSASDLLLARAGRVGLDARRGVRRRGTVSDAVRSTCRAL